MGHRYRLVWENLRLTVEPHEEHWQAFVYDETTCAVLYRAERMSVHGAKVSGVEFALWHLFGASHGQMRKASPNGFHERLWSDPSRSDFGKGRS
jgi:hypothetical protein